MGLHSSLKIKVAGSTHRSVLTRIERIKELMKKGLWQEGSQATGLPKTKIVKMKARKAAKAEKAEGAAGATAPAAGAPAPAAKAPASKAPAPKAQK